MIFSVSYNFVQFRTISYNPQFIEKSCKKQNEFFFYQTETKISITLIPNATKHAFITMQFSINVYPCLFNLLFSSVIILLTFEIIIWFKINYDYNLNEYKHKHSDAWFRPWFRLWFNDSLKAHWNQHCN